MVAPEAPLKVFLVAGEEERAHRRHTQDHGPPGSAAGPEPNLDVTLEDMRRRDAYDSSRATAPLAAAPDAVVVDTSGRSVADVVAEVLSHWQRVTGER